MEKTARSSDGKDTLQRFMEKRIRRRGIGAKNQVTAKAIKLTSYFGNTLLVAAFI